MEERLILRALAVCIVQLAIAIAGSPMTEPQFTASAQDRREEQRSWTDSLQPWSEYILTHVPQTAPKELIRQKRARNRYHRQGYPVVLSEVLMGDGLSALLSYIRMAFAVEFSMEHKVFWIIPPDPAGDVEGISFPDDWNVPPDPWKREWWYEK